MSYDNTNVQVSPPKSPTPAGSPKQETGRGEEGVVREEGKEEGGGGEKVRVRREKVSQKPLVEVKSAAITSIHSGCVEYCIHMCVCMYVRMYTYVHVFMTGHLWMVKSA